MTTGIEMDPELGVDEYSVSKSVMSPKNSPTQHFVIQHIHQAPPPPAQPALHASIGNRSSMVYWSLMIPLLVLGAWMVYDLLSHCYEEYHDYDNNQDWLTAQTVIPEGRCASTMSSGGTIPLRYYREEQCASFYKWYRQFYWVNVFYIALVKFLNHGSIVSTIYYGINICGDTCKFNFQYATITLISLIGSLSYLVLFGCILAILYFVNKFRSPASAYSHPYAQFPYFPQHPQLQHAFAPQNGYMLTGNYNSNALLTSGSSNSTNEGSNQSAYIQSLQSQAYKRRPSP